MKRKHSIFQYNFLVLFLLAWVICSATGFENNYEYGDYNSTYNEEYDEETDSYDEEYDEETNDYDDEYNEENATYYEKTTTYDKEATAYDVEITTRAYDEIINEESNYEYNSTESYIEGVTTARDIYTTDIPSLNHFHEDTRDNMPTTTKMNIFTNTQQSKNHQVDHDQTMEVEPGLQTTTPFSHILHMRECYKSEFGCCPDGNHPAHGPEYYGCCANSEYGCCPGNMDVASGPYDNGCDSSKSKYGLCPDAITIAIGEDSLGCGCRHMPNGCCPDGSTSAKGPGYEGCDCSTFEYGCCPDGESVAHGRHFEGCKSCNSDWGCCPDGITPKGASESCHECQNSKYGCCFDGKTPAMGLHFEGCDSDLSEDLPKKCSAKSMTGSCTDFQIKWFYDTQWGGCNKFWYGGCNPGDNHFDTEEECLGTCVNPRGSQVCYLDMNTGSCDAVYNEFYYDRRRGSCVPFAYGGCLGNGNRFTSKKACKDLCEKNNDMNVPVCSKPMAEGMCSGDFSRWYYDKEEGKCKNFSYSGCGGNNNRFISEEECSNTCRKDMKERLSQTVCRFSHQIIPTIKDGGPIFPAWTYDSLVRRCIPLYASSKDMEQDAFFSTWEECSNICPTTYPPVISLLRGPEILIERQSLAPIIAPISIKSNPPSNVQWFKNGQLIDMHHDYRYIVDEDFSLKLRGRTTDFDGGKYVVKAENGIGSPTTAEIEVVIYPLYSSVSIKVEKSIFKPGSDIIIPCVVKGYPPPTISWYKYQFGKQTPVIEDRQKILIDTFQTSTFITTSHLTISSSHTGDSGNYKCEAKSPHSPTASEGIKISVQYGPGEKCVDRPSYRHCHQVIKHRFCGNTYYAQYCCRSCMEAGFLPAGL